MLEARKATAGIVTLNVMRRAAIVAVACAGVLVMAGLSVASASAASKDLSVTVIGGGNYNASAARAVLADGGVRITCAGKPGTRASAVSGRIAGGARLASSPVMIGTVAALSFRNCRTSHGAAVTETAESLPYKVAVDSPTNSKRQTDAVITGIRIKVTIPSTGCKFLVTGSAPGFFANSKRQFAVTTKLPIRSLGGASLTVSRATGCSGQIHKGDHPALTAAYALSKKITIQSVVVAPDSADLAVTNTADNLTPDVGAMVHFTVSLTDLGPEQATNVTVRDLLPTGLSFESSAASAGSYDSSTGVWTLGTVSTSSPQILVLTAVVEAGGRQTSTATITHSDQPDADKANNTASVTVSQRADLAVLIGVNNSRPPVGTSVSFTVTLVNLGPDQAAGVSVHDLLPSGLSFVFATPSVGIYDSSTGVWTAGTVGTSDPQTLVITAIVTAGGKQTSTATITHSDQPDPRKANNTASVSIN